MFLKIITIIFPLNYFFNEQYSLGYSCTSEQQYLYHLTLPQSRVLYIFFTVHNYNFGYA